MRTSVTRLEGESSHQGSIVSRSGELWVPWVIAQLAHRQVKMNARGARSKLPSRVSPSHRRRRSIQVFALLWRVGCYDFLHTSVLNLGNRSGRTGAITDPDLNRDQTQCQPAEPARELIFVHDDSFLLPCTSCLPRPLLGSQKLPNF